MKKKLKELAECIHGTVLGDAEVEIHGVASIEDAKEGEKVEFGVLRKGAVTTIAVDASELSDSRMRHDLNFRFDRESMGFGRGEFRKQIQMLKENLRSAGQNLRLHMEQLRQQIRREIRSVAS